MDPRDPRDVKIYEGPRRTTYHRVGRAVVWLWEGRLHIAELDFANPEQLPPRRAAISFSIEEAAALASLVKQAIRRLKWKS